MESPRTKFGKYLMELVGTAILLLTIQVSVSTTAAGLAPVAIGVVLITIVYAGGPISGAHYNPAVSLAICLRGKMTGQEMFLYWAFQLAGGWLGALVGGIMAGAFNNIGVGEGYTTLQALLAEVVFTFLLCFVVLGVATHSKASDNHYYGAAIGLVVMSGAFTVGSISGGAFNPAVALGLGLSKGLGGISNLGYVLSAVLADFVGGALAAGCFYSVAPDEFYAVGSTIGETTNLV